MKDKEYQVMEDCLNEISGSAESKLIVDSELKRITTRLGIDSEFMGEYKTNSKNIGFECAGLISASISLSEGSVIHLKKSAKATNSKFFAEAILVEGEFQGSLKGNRIEVMPGAVIEGSIEYSVLELHAGSKVRGELKPI